MGRGVKLALTLIISATAFCARINAQAQDNLVLFWNLENFFDWTDGGNGDSDTEFTPGGKRRWTARKFYIILISGAQIPSLGSNQGRVLSGMPCCNTSILPNLSTSLSEHFW